MKGLGKMTAVAVLTAACGSNSATSGQGRHGSNDTPGTNEPHGEPMPHQQCVGSGGHVDAEDVNHDGRPDIWTVTRDGHVVCRESDANFDGRVDIYRWVDTTGRPTRVEDDYDFDGRIDSVGLYSGGVIQSDMLDTNFDGITDTWRTYVNGHLRELRRDSNGDGMVDTWERYDDTGRLVWAAEDTNHDGRPDSVTDAGVADPGTNVQVIPASGASVEATADAGVPDAATGTTPVETTQPQTVPAQTTPAQTVPTQTAPPTGTAGAAGAHKTMGHGR